MRAAAPTLPGSGSNLARHTSASVCEGNTQEEAVHSISLEPVSGQHESTPEKIYTSSVPEVIFRNPPTSLAQVTLRLTLLQPEQKYKGSVLRYEAQKNYTLFY